MILVFVYGLTWRTAHSVQCHSIVGWLAQREQRTNIQIDRCLFNVCSEYAILSGAPALMDSKLS